MLTSLNFHVFSCSHPSQCGYRDLTRRSMPSTHQQVWLPICSSCTVFSPCYFLAAPHTCCILVSWPRIESVSPALEAWNFNHWTTREVSSLPFRLWPPVTFMRITFRAKVEEKSMLLRKSHIDWNLNLYNKKYFSTLFFSLYHFAGY